MEYNRLIDHTLLRADASPQEITKLCEEANKWNFFSVCINPSYVPFVKDRLSGLNSKVKICTVIGFPLGQTSTKQKIYETKLAIRSGADEVDMVINIPEFKLGCTCVINEIRRVKQICGKRILKVIIETALLSDEEICKGTLVAIEGRADFVKTSTGFSTRGATVKDIEIMKKAACNKIQIKASGGIKQFSDMVALINAGATRIGTSRGVQLMEEWKQRK